MNNDEYYIALGEYIKSLQGLREKGVVIANGIIGETLTKDDLFFCASLDRCLHLIDGVIVMLKERNLTCAGPLLRLQMDNCMRTYAAFIAEDKAMKLHSHIPIIKQSRSSYLNISVMFS